MASRSVSAASAQEARGALVGRVSDSTGAVIPGKIRRTAPYKYLEITGGNVT